MEIIDKKIYVLETAPDVSPEFLKRVTDAEIHFK
jgi:acyl CoA:acetate/3-ketoacid CoA transferase beta subunit